MTIMEYNTKVLPCLGILLCLVLWISQSECQQRDCRFPKAWHGEWYQSGLGQIAIHGNRMSEKGLCIQHYTDYYIIEKRDRQCIMCLLMLERHQNIIQYKESYCDTRHTTQTACSNIQVEHAMYTLVKENVAGIPCPFHGNYQLDYKDYTHGFCGPSPLSRLQTCVDTDKLRFKFQHCDPTTVLHNADLQFECVATWKEGSEELVYGKFSGPTINAKQQSYRCFKYEKRSYDIYLSMSADATCRGLITPEIGPVVMKLERDLASFEGDCTYPNWMINKRWLDSSRQHRLSVHRQKLTLHPSHHAHGQPLKHLSCYDISQEAGAETFISGYFNRDSCYKNYNCLEVVEVHRSVFMLYVGEIYQSALNASQCKQRIPDRSTQHTFIDSSLERVEDRCPFPGKYTLPSQTPDCRMVVLVGCHSPDTVTVQSLCHNHTDSALTFSCKSHWREGESTALLLTDSHENLMCLTIKDRQKNIRIKRCKRPSEFYPVMGFYDNILLSKRGACPRVTTTQSSPGGNTRNYHTESPPHNNNNRDHSLDGGSSQADDNLAPTFINSFKSTTTYYTPPSSERVSSKTVTRGRTTTTPETVNIHSNTVRKQAVVRIIQDRTTTRPQSSSVVADDFHYSSSGSNSLSIVRGLGLSDSFGSANCAVLLLLLVLALLAGC